MSGQRGDFGEYPTQRVPQGIGDPPNVDAEYRRLSEADRAVLALLGRLDACGSFLDVKEAILNERVRIAPGIDWS